MVSRSLSVLVALIPAVAFANAVADENSEVQQAKLETWSDEQLCRARDIPEALDELERREVFDGRELRAIRRDDLRTRISEDALRCIKGSPQTILPAITTVEGDAVDAFVYAPGTIGSLIVYIRRQGDVSTVAAFTESAEPYMTPSWGSVNTMWSGGICSGRVMRCSPSTGANLQHQQAVSRAEGMAAATPSLPSQ